MGVTKLQNGSVKVNKGSDIVKGGWGNKGTEIVGGEGLYRDIEIVGREEGVTRNHSGGFFWQKSSYFGL